MYNYVELTSFELKIRHNLKEHKSKIDEVNKLTIGASNWMDDISDDLYKYLVEFAKNKLKAEKKEFEISNKTNYDNTKHFDNLIEETFFYLKINFDDYYLIDNNLTDEALNTVLYGNNLLIKKKLISKLLYYSLEEEIIDNLEFEDGLFKLSKKAYEYYIIEENTIPLTIDEKMYNSMSRTHKKFKDLIMCNCDKFTNFITLTFADVNNINKYKKLDLKENEYDIEFSYVDDPTNYEKCIKVFTRFLETMKKNLKRRNLEFYYVAVPEYQKNGNIHYHLLTSDIPQDLIYKVPLWLDVDYYAKKQNSLYIRRNDIGITKWIYGKSVIEKIKDNGKVSTYLSKYMQKNIVELDKTKYYDNLNKKRYYNSTNLKKPLITYSNELIEVEYVDKYETKSVSVFNDSQIKKTLYQINNFVKE